MEFRKREIAHVLAALRLSQGGENDLRSMPHFAGIEPLSPEEIDRLCERINCESTEANQYTVVGLHPDTEWDGDMHDASFCDFVQADNVIEAARKARLRAAKTRLAAPNESDDSEATEEARDYADSIVILCVFEGQRPDLYDPSDDRE